MSSSDLLTYDEPLVQRKSSKTIIFDISNLLYRAFYANKSADDVTAAGMAHHMALMSLNKYFRQFRPDKVIMAFDRPNNWRKQYTSTDACLSQKPYKGNRRQTMTPTERAKFEAFVEHLAEFEDMMRVHTSVVCLAEPGLEADDLIAGVVQTYTDDTVIVVSADRDMVQLLKYPNVQLIDPASGKDRRKEFDRPLNMSKHAYGGDADLFIFNKCLRGDTGDNVGSAYPRIRTTKILECYEDPYKYTNLMNETWTDQNGREMRVGDVFKENRLLMDLSAQPPEIRQQIAETIKRETANPGNFSMFHFLKFCGKYDLKNIAKSIEQFVPLLSK